MSMGLLAEQCCSGGESRAEMEHFWGEGIRSSVGLKQLDGSFPYSPPVALRAKWTGTAGQICAEHLRVHSALPSLLVSEGQLGGPITPVDRWDV